MAEEAKAAEPKVEDKLLTQAQVDAIVQDRLAREKSKYSDYEDLRKFKTEYERNLDAKTQKELEDKKEYEKSKEVWSAKERDYQGVISKKEADISNLKIETALSVEINKQNAYAEESMALIKQQAVFDKEGNIRIKGRDANGLEVMDSVEEGIKKFLTHRPHLVKATNKAGGGTGAGGSGVGTGAGVVGDDLNSLNTQMAEAMHARDTKRVGELRTKITATLAAKGIHR